MLKGNTHNKGQGDPVARTRATAEINFRYFEEGGDGVERTSTRWSHALEFVLRHHQGLRQADRGGGGYRAHRSAAAKTCEDFVRNQAWGHHASCTCTIGAKDGDDMAVLDSSFRVRGTEGLRVVDASVFPRIPGFFIVVRDLHDRARRRAT